MGATYQPNQYQQTMNGTSTPLPPPPQLQQQQNRTVRSVTPTRTMAPPPPPPMRTLKPTSATLTPIQPPPQFINQQRTMAPPPPPPMNRTFQPNQYQQQQQMYQTQQPQLQQQAQHTQQQQQTTSPVLYTVVAQFAYQGQQKTDLSFNKGDRIVIFKEVSKEWLYGGLNGKVGIFPSNFVQRV